MPTGPVTVGKAWIEMIHRYLATGVGVLILVLAVASWLGRAGSGKSRMISPWWPTLTLIWVCLQGAFGALTVTMKLFPAIVTLHLVGGLTLLALLSVQVVRSAQAQGNAVLTWVAPGVRRLMWVTLALLIIQVVLGGWVSTNYAVLACSEFPKCQGSWWPVMNFSQGFEFWRSLGQTAEGEAISFAALTAIHYVHRSMAFIVLAGFGLLAWQLNRLPALRTHSRWLAGLISLQLITGLSNVVLGWPLVAAVLHTGGAGALVIVMTWTLAGSRTSASPLTWAPQASNSAKASLPA
jgi:cytochrome c oxidase assembly protein subunit 15